jgi:hypothetical protein
VPQVGRLVGRHLHRVHGEHHGPPRPAQVHDLIDRRPPHDGDPAPPHAAAGEPRRERRPRALLGALKDNGPLDRGQRPRHEG